MARLFRVVERLRLYLYDLGEPVVTWKRIASIHCGRSRTWINAVRTFGRIAENLPRLII